MTQKIDELISISQDLKKQLIEYSKLINMDGGLAIDKLIDLQPSTIELIDLVNWVACKNNCEKLRK